MEFSRQIENLVKDIQDIERKIAGLAGTPSVPTLEMDLLKKRVQRFYEDLLKLADSKESETVADESEIIQRGHPENEKTIEESPASSTQPPLREDVEHPEPVTAEEPNQEPPVEDIANSDTGGNEDPAEKKKKPEVLADRFKDKQQFRNEHLIKGQALKDLSSKYDEQPLSDIALGIGLNERFQYIKELFQGSSTDFKQTIDYLNNVNTEDEAVAYLNEHFNWDMKNVLVIRLLHLTRRKLKMNIDG